MTKIEGEKYIQHQLFEEKDLPPKQEFDHFLGLTTYEMLDQPMKDLAGDDYYVITDYTKFNIYPSQFRYVDNAFAIVSKGGELDVFARQNLHQYYGPFMNSEGWWDKKCVVTPMWVEDNNILINPNSLKKLKVLGGKELNNASREEVGGKSLGETELKPYEYFGYKVPEFITVPTSFSNILQIHGFEGRMEQVMKECPSAEDVARMDGIGFESVAGWVPRKIVETFELFNYYENIFKPYILPAVTKLCRDHNSFGMKGPLARFLVRSSSPLEDGEKNLFQGVFASRSASFYINDEQGWVQDEDLYKSFCQVLLSPWTAYAESYLRHRNLVGKVSRSIAEMIQIIPENLKFVGRGYFNQGSSEIEYLDHVVDSGDYVGNKIFIDKGIVQTRIDNVKDYGLRGIGDFGELLSNDQAIKVSQIMEKLSAVLPKYESKFNIEFGIDKDGTIYLFQIRSTKRMSDGIVPDLSQIEREKVLFECSEYCSPFSIGKVVGPVVNLLDTKNPWNKMPPNEYLEHAAELDKKYPGSIFIVHLNKPSIREFHMLTPNKVGLIVCYGHDHFTRNDHIVEELYRDPTFHVINVLPDLFENIKTGTRLGIVSSGEKAAFYIPDQTETNTLIHERPTVFNRGDIKPFFQRKEYVQRYFYLGTKNKLKHKKVTL